MHASGWNTLTGSRDLADVGTHVYRAMHALRLSRESTAASLSEPKRNFRYLVETFNPDTLGSSPSEIGLD